MKKYIPLDDLVAEIKRQLSAIDNCPKLTDTQIAVLEGNKVVLTKLFSFINNLEVKEISDKYDEFLGKELKMIDDEIARLEKLKVKGE